MMTMNKTSTIFFILLFLMPVCMHSKENADTLKLTKPKIDRKEIRSTQDKVVEIIHSIEEGRLKPGFENLKYFI